MLILIITYLTADITQIGTRSRLVRTKDVPGTFTGLYVLYSYNVLCLLQSSKLRTMQFGTKKSPILSYVGIS